MATLCHVEVCGSDQRMDQRGNFDLPVNPLPVKCPRCTFPDVDFVPQPYHLAKGMSKPTEMQQAELGNFFVRERTRKILEVVAPGQCQFFPTHDLKGKAATPWFLAVPITLIHTATVKKSVPRCPDCGEPKVAHPGSHYEYQDMGVVTQDVFKSSNWSSSESIGEESRWYYMHILGWKKREKVPPDQWTRISLGRELYFSIRLVTLLKSLGIRGLFPFGCDDEKPNADDRAWVDEKLRLLVQQGLVEKPAVKPSPTMDKWFRNYLKTNAANERVRYDFAALEKKHGVELPLAYKEFISTVGEKSYFDVDGTEGFTVHVLLPQKLDFRSYRKGRVQVADEESSEVDGLMVALTDHGDCFCFDLSASAPNYPVFHFEHELNGFEPYAQDFKEFIKRCAGK